MTHLTVYVSAPANTMLASILTLSLLLKTHIPGGLKALTYRRDAFHQWTLKIQKDFCLNKTKPLLGSEKKKYLNLSVDTNRWKASGIKEAVGHEVGSQSAKVHKSFRTVNRKVGKLPPM